MKPLNPQQGYIALMSAIIISALLLTITVSLGFSGFLGRLSIVDSQSKERSSALAEGCADTAILEATSGIYSMSAKTVNIGSDTCTIVSSQKDVPSTGQSTIKTQAVINKAYTNLKVIINNSNFTVISWDECAVGPCP